MGASGFGPFGAELVGSPAAQGIHWRAIRFEVSLDKLVDAAMRSEALQGELVGSPTALQLSGPDPDEHLLSAHRLGLATGCGAWPCMGDCVTFCIPLRMSLSAGHSRNSIDARGLTPQATCILPPARREVHINNSVCCGQEAKPPGHEATLLTKTTNP